jgi:hypothetical protein
VQCVPLVVVLRAAALVREHRCRGKVAGELGLVVGEDLGREGVFGRAFIEVLGEGEGFDVLSEGWLVDEGAGEEPPFLGVRVVVEMAGGRVLEAARGEAEGVQGEDALFAVPVP